MNNPPTIAGLSFGTEQNEKIKRSNNEWIRSVRRGKISRFQRPRDCRKDSLFERNSRYFLGHRVTFEEEKLRYDLLGNGFRSGNTPGILG